MNFVEIENQHYILATSSYADQRVMVLKEGDTFAIFDWFGDIHQLGTGQQGIFHEGTRFVSCMELNLNGQRPLLLSASPRQDNQMLRIDLTNPDLHTASDEAILRGTLHIQRKKFLWQSTFHEQIALVNFGLEPISFIIGINFQADFTDIFEVRGEVRSARGRLFAPVYEQGRLTFEYEGLDNVKRKAAIRFTPSPRSCYNNNVEFEITLMPRQQTELQMEIAFLLDDDHHAPTTFEKARAALNDHMERADRYCAEIVTSNEQFNEWVRRSKSDLITMTSRTPHGLYPYAGVPWYSTPFGRDGIITAIECLWVEPDLAKGVLNYLARTQATGFDDFRDAEPGKIFHETRGGEMAALDETPFKMYYGTIDATPLFICLAGLYLERTGDVKMIKKIWPNIRMALTWMEQYGDIDGDGFLEYKTKSSKGLTNQGWKDSQDAIFYEDGRLAADPIALCEVQGYAYDAFVKAAQMASALGEEQTAVTLREKADRLKEKFNDFFWSEEKQTYVLALDGQKNQCNVLSSNAGHCLFSGIATPDRARKIAERFLQENMFSGFGIRTIATDEARYNPMSYHNGSIWPHDNAMIALGFSQYKLMTEASQVLKAIFDTTLFMDAQRLPELFCGFPREKGKPPTLYPVACSPQAWSVGAVFMMLQACLGMEISAKTQTITFRSPMLPDFLKDLTITNLRLGNRIIALQVRKTTDGIEAQLLSAANGLKVEVMR